jgi:hypothetical protein
MYTTSASPPTCIVIGQVLSFVNEHDFVTRADAPYTSSLVDLFRSAHAHAPTSRASGTTSAITAGIAEMGRYATADIGGESAPPLWVLPPQRFFQVGDVVLLAKRRQAGQGVGLVAQAVGVEELQPLVFARLEVHHMAEYLQRVKVLAAAA